jgi:hypothetical protein
LDINEGNWGLKRCVAQEPDIWETVPRTDFDDMAPSTCTPDSWYYNASTTAPSRGVFYCAPNGRLYPMRMSNIQSFAVMAGAHHYRLLGLHFNVVPFPNPPPDYWGTHFTTPGTYYKVCLVWIKPHVSNSSSRAGGICTHLRITLSSTDACLSVVSIRCACNQASMVSRTTWR